MNFSDLQLNSKDSRNRDVSTLYDVFDWHVFTWKIDNLQLIPREANYAVQSPVFYFKSATWILKMFMYGQTEFNTEGYVDVIIERLNSKIQVHKILGKMYCKNDKESNYKKLCLVFDSQWSYSRVHRFIHSPQKCKLNDPITLVFQFGHCGLLVSEPDSQINIDDQDTMDRKERVPEMGEIFKEYLEFKSLRWKVFNLLSPPPADYRFSSPSFSFANGSWVLHMWPSFTEDSKEVKLHVALERLSSEILQQNVMFKICLSYPFEKIVDRSLLFNSSHTQKEVFDFPFVAFFHTSIEMKIKNPAIGDCSISKSSDVLENLKKLFLSQEDCDVIIKVKGEKFPAHRLILKTQSPVFAAAFRSDMQEKMTGVLEIDDCEPSTFSDFLHFLYCGELRKLSVKTAFNLFTIADKYNVPDLRSVCLDFIKLNLSIDTFCETITLAVLHSESEIAELSTNFLAKNLQGIIKNEKWKSFAVENPKLSDELKLKAQKSNEN